MPENADTRYFLPNELLRYNPEKYTHWLLRHFGINSGAENVAEYSKRLAEIVKLDVFIKKAWKSYICHAFFVCIKNKF